MSLRTVYIIVYLGLLGFLIFLAFRPVIDLHSGIGVESHASQARQAATELMYSFGLEQIDDYIPIARRLQRSYLYTDLIDSLGRSDNRNPAALNRAGIPLGGWSVMFLESYDQMAGILGDESLFQEYGLVRVTFDNELRVRSFSANPDRANVLFSGETFEEALKQVMHASGFNPDFYALELDSVVFDRSDFNRNNSSSVSADPLAKFIRTASSARTPERIYVTFNPVWQQVTSNLTDEVALQHISVSRIFSSFTSLDTDTPLSSDFEIGKFLLLFISMAAWIILLLVVAGRLIFRGEVIWFRALVVASSVVVLLMVHRYLSMQYFYYPIFSGSVIALDMLFYLANALSAGLFTGMAYLIWDAYARRLEHEQIPHIDAIWNRNLFQQKIGKAILAGYGYAGVSLGLFALGLYAFGSIYTISDDSFGFTGVVSKFPILTNLINSLSYVPIVGYAFIGVTVSLTQSIFKRTWMAVLLSTLISAIFIGFAVTFVTVTGSITAILVAMALLTFPLILAYKYYGIITAGVALWILFLVVRLGAFLGSSDQVILTQGYVLSVVLLVPLGLGFVLHHFGRDDLIYQNFVPEYENRLKQQLRIEREFQIAKESQFAMMPKSAPIAPGIDIKGFFIPSYEVGGDFYDHVVISDSQGEPAEIMLTVVDVSGKAMKAALTAIFTSGLLLSNSRYPDLDPADVLTGINPILYERTDKQSFTTCLLARYELATKVLHFVNAGHCQPILKRDGKAAYLKSSDPRLPLGIRPQIQYVSSHVQLETGDVLMLFSDGLPEARSKTGDIYEFDRVLETLEMLDTDSMTAEQICEFLKQEILTFSDYELADDMTVVVVRI
ncbi:MAG: serine/threonine-protein phosphatase [Bacteroidetes bacterium]|nr:serine/threonine-protein phosphatase [Bacteroidota bacterium]MCH8523420.1 serine/threonine-protein phosphatase [Balneolales bacterium]